MAINGNDDKNNECKQTALQPRLQVIGNGRVSFYLGIGGSGFYIPRYLIDPQRLVPVLRRAVQG